MKIVPFAAALVLAGCASKPAPPSWQPDALSAIDSFTDDYLKGASAAAASDFARARAATGGTGNPVLVAQVELVRCAAQTASLAGVACDGFAALAQDASPEQRAYAAYLAGNWNGLHAALLPEQHRAVVAGGAIAAIADPLARLVAAGAAMQAGRLTPDGIATAVETASAQGWRRPLLTWLGVALKRAEAGGDVEAAARLRRRIAIAQP